MKKDKKLYKVELGLLDKECGDIQNWSSKNVIAGDALEAMRKVRLRKNTYVNGVSVIASVDG